MTPRAIAALTVAVGSLALLGASGAQTPAPTARPAVQVAAHTVTVKPATCHAPAPTTAHGYAAMFAHLNPAEWGAADVSISVPISGGRSVWLYGDTFSTGRFVHSTAIVQHGGCLHVSHAGAQLLPNTSPTRIYWIDAARWTGKALAVRARATVINPTGGPWAFHDAGTYRWFYATVSPAGDLTVAYKGASHRSPLHQVNDFHVVGPHHFTYARHTHTETHLTSGRVLVTVCQNWDDGVMHPFPDYRPIFSSK